MSKKVAVLTGGRSAEREISLRTGGRVHEALLNKGYDATKVMLDDDVAATLKRLEPDVVFIALHGRFGEDGTVQGMLEVLGIPYTGSGVLASALAIDKAVSKVVFTSAGINTPAFRVLGRTSANTAPDTEGIIEEVGLPLVVKPACEGSTVGMTIVRDPEELGPAIDLAFSCDAKVVLERFVEGVEITVGVLGNDPVALPTLEIVTTTGFYDYDTKYTPGLSEHIIPARIPEEHGLRAQEVAVAAHKAIGCRGFSRVDIIVDTDGGCHVLEINTIPGMTDVSLFPDAARAAGYEFSDLIAHIVEMALQR